MRRGHPQEELVKCFAAKYFGNYELIKGDILETVPRYANEHKELKIVLLHIDVDMYAPSRVILEQLFDRIVPGGLLVLDDYGTVYGETKAVDEFLKKNGLALRLEKLPFYKIPVFLVKK